MIQNPHAHTHTRTDTSYFARCAWRSSNEILIENEFGETSRLRVRACVCVCAHERFRNEIVLRWGDISMSTKTHIRIAYMLAGNSISWCLQHLCITQIKRAAARGKSFAKAHKPARSASALPLRNCRLFHATWDGHTYTREQLHVCSVCRSCVCVGCSRQFGEDYCFRVRGCPHTHSASGKLWAKPADQFLGACNAGVERKTARGTGVTWDYVLNKWLSLATKWKCYKCQQSCPIIRARGFCFTKFGMGWAWHEKPLGSEVSEKQRHKRASSYHRPAGIDRLIYQHK